MKTSHRRRIAPSAGRLLVAAVVIATLVLPAAAASAAPWFTEPFSTGESDVFSGWGWRATGEGEGGGPGLFTPIAKNSHYGANEHVQLSAIGQHDRDEMYWRYWLRLDPDFTIPGDDRGKLPGPAALSATGCRGGNVSTPSSPCWSARMMFKRDQSFAEDGKDYVAKDYRALLGSYVYHVDGPEGKGDELMWGRDGRIEAGSWYCVEGRVSMNTPGANDGVLQQWLDGERVFDERFQFRREGEGDLGVASMWMNVYYGHGSVTSPIAQGVWADSLVLGPSRVGCGATPEVSFGDHRASIHRADIEWLAKRGITRGCNPPQNTQYCPEAAVTRGQMAVFLQRALELPDVAGDRFDDDNGSAWESAAEALAAADVTRGCNPPDNDRFCPDDPVTRDQMAAFLTRAWNLPKTDAEFTDTADSVFIRDIGALEQSGVTHGCNPPDNTRYCPADRVTREQMASFVRRVSVLGPQ